MEHRIPWHLFCSHRTSKIALLLLCVSRLCRLHNRCLLSIIFFEPIRLYLVLGRVPEEETDLWLERRQSSLPSSSWVKTMEEVIHAMSIRWVLWGICTPSWSHSISAFDLVIGFYQSIQNSPKQESTLSSFEPKLLYFLLLFDDPDNAEGILQLSNALELL